MTEPSTIDGPTVGVVVMAYGTPRLRDELLDYYTHIRRGSPPPAELLDELAGRYDAIGGLSPLAERTEAQRAAIARALEARGPGRFTALGQRHALRSSRMLSPKSPPGREPVVGLVLTPHYARASVGQYERAAAP